MVGDIFKHLAPFEQRRLLLAVVEHVSSATYKSHAFSLSTPLQQADTKDVSAWAAVLKLFLDEGDPSLGDHLVLHLVKRPLASLVAMRAATSALDSALLESTLERSWQCFADQLEIRHRPIIQQEGKIYSGYTG